MRAFVLALAACGAQSAPEVPRNTTPPSTAASAPCPRDGTARLTIVTGPLPTGCEGGRYLIDGREMGSYPMSCAKVPAGLHTVGIQSANDCAGYMKCKLDLVADGETVFDLRNPTCMR